MTRLAKNLFIFFLIILVSSGIYFFYSLEQRLPSRNLSELMYDLNNNQVRSLEVVGDKIKVTNSSDFIYSTIVPDAHHILAGLTDEKIKITFRKDHSTIIFFVLLLAVTTTLIFITLFSLRASSGKEKRKKFGSDKFINPESGGNRVLFKDVAGIPEVKEELREIVSILQECQALQSSWRFTS